MIEIKNLKCSEEHIEINSLKAEGTVVALTSDVLNILDTLMDPFKKNGKERYVKLIISAWAAGLLDDAKADDSKEEEANDTL